MQQSHYKTLAQWFKEIGLLIFAALVVQNIVKGIEIFDPAVIAEGVISFILRS